MKEIFVSIAVLASLIIATSQGLAENWNSLAGVHFGDTRATVAKHLGEPKKDGVYLDGAVQVRFDNAGKVNAVCFNPNNLSDSEKEVMDKVVSLTKEDPKLQYSDKSESDLQHEFGAKLEKVERGKYNFEYSYRPSHWVLVKFRAKKGEDGKVSICIKWEGPVEPLSPEG